MGKKNKDRILHKHKKEKQQQHSQEQKEYQHAVMGVVRSPAPRNVNASNNVQISKNKKKHNLHEMYNYFSNSNLLPQVREQRLPQEYFLAANDMLKENKMRSWHQQLVADCACNS